MAKAKAKQTEYALMVEPLSDADGGGCLATVPALPGCMGDGDTPKAALADAEAAIIEWHAAAKQLGREVPGAGSLGQWRQRVPRGVKARRA
jgi:antitoxin HicB